MSARHESLNNYVAKMSAVAPKGFPRNTQRTAVRYSQHRGKKRA